MLSRNSKENKIETIVWNCGKPEVDKAKRITIYETDNGFVLKEQKTNFFGFWKTVKEHKIAVKNKTFALNVAKDIAKRVPGYWYDANIK